MAKTKRPFCRWCAAGNKADDAGEHWVVKSVIPAKISIFKCLAITAPPAAGEDGR